MNKEKLNKNKSKKNIEDKTTKQKINNIDPKLNKNKKTLIVEQNETILIQNQKKIEKERKKNENLLSDILKKKTSEYRTFDRPNKDNFKIQLNKSTSSVIKKLDKIEDTKDLLLITAFISKSMKLNNVSKTIQGADNYITTFRYKDLQLFIKGVGFFNKKSIYTKIWIIISILMTLHYYINYYLPEIKVSYYGLVLVLIRNFTPLGFITKLIERIFWTDVISAQFAYLNRNTFFGTLRSIFIGGNFVSSISNLYSIYYYGGLLEYKIDTSIIRICKHIPNKYLMLSVLFFNTLGCSWIYLLVNKRFFFYFHIYGNSLMAISMTFLYIMLFPNDLYLVYPNNNKKSQQNSMVGNLYQNMYGRFFNKLRNIDYFVTRYVYLTVFRMLIMFVPMLGFFFANMSTYSDSITLGLDDMHIVICFYTIFFGLIFFYQTIQDNLDDKSYYLESVFTRTTMRRMIVGVIVFLIFGILFSAFYVLAGLRSFLFVRIIMNKIYAGGIINVLKWSFNFLFLIGKVSFNLSYIINLLHLHM